MYSLNYSPQLFYKISTLGVDYPSLLKKVESLSKDPFSIAKPTNNNVFCDYYVNAGRHAILFDIDEVNNLVKLRHVLLRANLFKVLQGSIKSPI